VIQLQQLKHVHAARACFAHGGDCFKTVLLVCDVCSEKEDERNRTGNMNGFPACQNYAKVSGYEKLVRFASLLVDLHAYALTLSLVALRRGSSRGRAGERISQVR